MNGTQQSPKTQLNRLLHSPLVLTVVVFLLVLAPRIAQLDVFYGPDETFWMGVSAAFNRALDQGRLQDTYQVGHPGVSLFWVDSMASWLRFAVGGGDWESICDPNDYCLRDLAARRQAVAITNALMITLAVLAIRSLYGNSVAWVSAILLAFDPFLLTESRAFRPEGLLVSFTFLALLCLLLYLKTRGIGYAALAGWLLALALLSKVTGAALVPVGIMVFLLAAIRSSNGWRPKQRCQNAMISLAVWIGATVAAIWLLWPALWVEPVQVLRKMFDYVFLRAVEGGGGGRLTFFMGQPTAYDELGFLFYPVVILFRTGPWVWLGSLLLAITIWDKSRWRLGTRVSVGISGVFLLLHLVLISNSGLKFDRYVMSIFPVLALWAALGLVAVYQHFKQLRTIPIWLGYAAVVFLLLTQLALTLPHHPYYYTYWNPLLGGSRVAVKVLPIGVGYEGIEKVAHYVDGLPGAENIKLASGNSGKIKPLFRGETIPMSDLDGKWLQGDYVFIYISQLQRGKHNPGIIDYLKRQPPIYTIVLNGMEYGWLYPGPAATYPGGDTKLEGRGTLFAFDLSNTRLRAGQSLTVTSYFRNEGQGSNDEFFVHVSDSNDYIWAEGIVRPRPGFEDAFGIREAIVEGEVKLTLPVGMPPGQYVLKMGYRLADSDQLIGRFELPSDADDLQVSLPTVFPEVESMQIPHQRQMIVGGELALLGYGLSSQQISTHQPTWLTLYWQALSDIDHDYVLGLQLLEDSGKELHYWLGRPAFSSQQTDQWKAGRIVQDPWPLSVTEAVLPGSYHLVLNVYDAADAEQVASIQIGSVRVSSAPQNSE